ncbi:hypothetical protein AAFF_G00377580 [Aldrovandia affinis]|uniref:Uncharacterized protein n=1 Tax=Aldrovandia affinis TaxID=143900 RepID=A0AAD7WLZ2_9TELE|nr:hypothetical protein AAFF_G00377580 [Aldrovandia affinis]
MSYEPDSQHRLKQELEVQAARSDQSDRKHDATGHTLLPSCRPDASTCPKVHEAHPRHPSSRDSETKQTNKVPQAQCTSGAGEELMWEASLDDSVCVTLLSLWPQEPQPEGPSGGPVR